MGRVEEEIETGGMKAGGGGSVRVRVEGFANYMGYGEHVIEEEDAVGRGGFKFDELFSS